GRKGERGNGRIGSPSPDIQRFSHGGHPPPRKRYGGQAANTERPDAGNPEPRHASHEGTKALSAEARIKLVPRHSQRTKDSRKGQQGRRPAIRHSRGFLSPIRPFSHSP